jgi:repressor LexA
MLGGSLESSLALEATMAELKKLTNRQREVYDFIVEFRREHAYVPTIREISYHFKFNIKSAHDHLKALARKGWIRRAGKGSRAIEILGPSGSMDDFDVQVARIPMAGRIAAGPTSHREENLDEYFVISSDLVPSSGNMYMVEVDGDSMIDSGILPGDKIVVRKQTAADVGDIVLAKVQGLEEEYTIKRLIKKGNKYFLKPENPKLDLIPFDPTKGGEIRGVVVGLWRGF